MTVLMKSKHKQLAKTQTTPSLKSTLCVGPKKTSKLLACDPLLHVSPSLCATVASHSAFSNKGH